MRCAIAPVLPNILILLTFYDIVLIYHKSCLSVPANGSRFLWLPIALIQDVSMFSLYIYSRLTGDATYTLNESGGMREN